MVISSLVVEAQPGMREAVASALGAIEGVEVHNVDENGNVVVTIEAETIDDSHDIASSFIGVDGVTGVNLVYANFEDDPSLQRMQERLQERVDGSAGDAR